MSGWMPDLLWIFLAAVLVAVNGFFVAAEFALVKVRAGQIQAAVERGRPFAGTANWLLHRLDPSLSACQLGITMASLGLGWVGEPAFARLIEPMLHKMGITSPELIHGISFAVAFTLITALHIVIGEQVPKIYAIRKPVITTLASALPLRMFYAASLPLILALNGATKFLLRLLGIRSGEGGHDTPHSEEELRRLLHHAHTHGNLGPLEHDLLDAVFDLGELVSRKIMVPRSEVVHLDVGASREEALAIARRTRHSRYPVTDGSLDAVAGILHVKDLLKDPDDGPFDLRGMLRPAMRIPETLPVVRLLRQFQRTRQLMALVLDEYGNTIGVVTLENVLEQLVGPVEDEFDNEQPDIHEEGPGRFVIQGGTLLEVVNRRLGLELEAKGIDTLSGYLVASRGRMLESGEKLPLPEATAEVLETRGGRAARVRITLENAEDEDQSGVTPPSADPSPN